MRGVGKDATVKVLIRGADARDVRSCPKDPTRHVESEPGIQSCKWTCCPTGLSR